jgi:integrase
MRDAARIAATPPEKRRVVEVLGRDGRKYRVREQPLSPTSINKTITRLGAILEVAVEYDMVGRNPAKGKRRRVKAAKPAPVWLDRAEHTRALLDAAGEIDARARRDRRHIPRRAILATLVLAGLRIGELLDLRWRDVDLTAGRITCGRPRRTPASRQVDVVPALRAILAMVPRRGPGDLVFPTMTGRRQGATNVRRRVLAPAVKRANERLGEAGEVPLPERLTPHKLRHTFASLLVALGVDPGSVMDQLGHTDPGFTLRVYRHGMRRDQASKDALRELVGGADWAATGSNVVQAQFSIASGGALR